MKILDTHLGSGTIEVACYNADVTLYGCEISADYLAKAKELIGEHVPAKYIKEYLPGKLKSAKPKS